MEKIDPSVFKIGKRVEVTAEEQAQRDREDAEWNQTQYYLLHPEAWIYHQVFERKYKIFEDCSFTKSPHGKEIEACLSKGKGLYLWGETGVGKTYLALCCLKWQLDRKQTGFIWTVSELLDRIRYFVGLKDSWSLERAVEQFSTNPFLILDDFGVEATSFWADEQLYEVINRRWLNKDNLITIVTSQYAPPELEARAKSEVVGSRIVSRLLGMCEVIHIQWAKDRRLEAYGKQKK